MVNISDVPSETLIAGLKDTDSEVVASLVKALEVHRDADAVDELVNILIGGLSKDPKQAAINTLDVYGQTNLREAWQSALRCYSLVEPLAKQTIGSILFNF